MELYIIRAKSASCPLLDVIVLTGIIKPRFIQQGLAIAVDETMYIADGRNVRVVTPDGNIETLLGDQGCNSADIFLGPV